MSWTTPIIQVEVLICALLAWGFVLLYGIRSPWRVTVVGRSLMYVWISLAVILTRIASLALGDYPYRDEIGLLVYTSLPIALGKFLWVLWQVQQGRMRGEIPARVDTKL